MNELLRKLDQYRERQDDEVRQMMEQAYQLGRDDLIDELQSGIGHLPDKELTYNSALDPISPHFNPKTWRQ